MSEPWEMEICGCGKPLYDCRDRRHRRRQYVEVVPASDLSSALEALERIVNYSPFGNEADASYLIETAQATLTRLAGEQKPPDPYYRGAKGRMKL